LYTGDQLRVFVEFPELARTGTMESEGKAAEIAGLTRADFLEALFRAKVPACQITVEELKVELESWQRLSGESSTAPP
jgi:hypothetical protein